MRRLLLTSLLTASLLGASAPAAAEPPPAPPADKAAQEEEAKARFARGVALFREGDLAAALAEFRRAHALSGSYRVLYNVGQTEFEMQSYAAALVTLRRYLAEGGEDIDPERRAAVQADITTLEGRVARIIIRVDVPGAEIAVDDLAAGKGPLTEPVLVSAGRRRITISAPGYTTINRTIELAGRDTLTLNITLSPIAPPPPPPRLAPWLTGAGAFALAAGGVTTGILTLRSKASTQDKLATFGSTRADIEHAHRQTVALGATTDALLIASALMGGVTVFLALREPARPRAAALLITPRAIAVSGSF